MLVLIALWNRRLRLVLPLGVVVSGSAFLIWQATRRPSLADALSTATAERQGDAMLLIVAGTCLIAGLLVGGVALAARRGRIPAAPAVPRRPALAALATVAVVLVAAFFAVGGAGRVADGFDDFKQPGGVGRDSSRLTSVVGNGRWQYWSAGAEAGAESPLTGIGPGTFVFFWAQEREADTGFVRDAHSLFVEAFAELGVIGLFLIAGFVVLLLATGVSRALRCAGERRAELAAATAAMAAFALAAGADWLWEMAVVPIAFLLVASTVVGREAAAAEPVARGRRGRLAAAGAVVVARRRHRGHRPADGERAPRRRQPGGLPGRRSRRRARGGGDGAAICSPSRPRRGSRRPSPSRAWAASTKRPRRPGRRSRGSGRTGRPGTC